MCVYGTFRFEVVRVCVCVLADLISYCQNGLLPVPGRRMGGEGREEERSESWEGSSQHQTVSDTNYGSFTTVIYLHTFSASCYTLTTC